MPDNSNSLKLIQRAAKRLNAREDAAAQVPGQDTHRTFAGQESPQAPSNVDAHAPDLRVKPAETQAAAAVGPGPIGPMPVDRSVRLKLSEMRLNGIITPDDMTSSIAQEYRSIKRKLLSNARNQKTRVIDNNLVMITSALPREGKTFTAINLAISLAAERDLHVLLIDGDVIHPSLSAMFEPPRGTGLVELLTGECRNIGDVMCRCTDIPNLNVVFAGRPDVKTPELVSSRRMADICKDVSSRYPDRMIIIDTPPVLASAEPASIAAHVHQILMVVAAGQSNRAQVQSALENISACRNISLLFNKAPEWCQIEGDSYYDYHRGRAAAAS